MGAQPALPSMWGLMAGLPGEDLPTLGAVSIEELAANGGSSWMLQAPNLHFAM